MDRGLGPWGPGAGAGGPGSWGLEGARGWGKVPAKAP